jgi:hypothetical protein
MAALRISWAASSVPAVHAALEAVNSAGSVDHNLVAIEARRITEGRRPTGSSSPSALKQ